MKIFKLRKVLILYKIIFYVYIFLTKRSSALTNQKKKTFDSYEKSKVLFTCLDITCFCFQHENSC